MKIPFRIVVAHARKSKFRTALTVGSVFVAMFVFGALRTAVDSLQVSLQEVSSTRLVTESEVSLFESLQEKMVHEIAALPGVRVSPPKPGEERGIPHVAHMTWFGGTYVDESRFFGRFGVDPETFRATYEKDIETYGNPGESSDLIWRRFSETRTGCIVGADLQAQYGWNIGDRVTLMGSIFPGTYAMEVVGFYRSKVASYDQSTLYMQWQFLNETSKANGGINGVVSIFVTGVENPDRADELAAAIDALYANSDKRTRTQTERAFNAQFASMWGGMPVFFAVLGIVALIASLVVALNTAILNQQERVREIGVMKTLGFTDASVLVIGLVESVVVFGSGAALGALALAALDGKTIPMLGLPMAASVERSTLLVVVGILLGGLAGVLPAVRGARLKIVDALRRRA